jgi:hypothetical protein
MLIVKSLVSLSVESEVFCGFKPTLYALIILCANSNLINLFSENKGASFGNLNSPCLLLSFLPSSNASNKSSLISLSKFTKLATSIQFWSAIKSLT